MIMSRSALRPYTCATDRDAKTGELGRWRRRLTYIYDHGPGAMLAVLGGGRHRGLPDAERGRMAPRPLARHLPRGTFHYATSFGRRLALKRSSPAGERWRLELAVGAMGGLSLVDALIVALITSRAFDAERFAEHAGRWTLRNFDQGGVCRDRVITGSGSEQMPDTATYERLQRRKGRERRHRGPHEQSTDTRSTTLPAKRESRRAAAMIGPHQRGSTMEDSRSAAANDGSGAGRPAVA